MSHVFDTETDKPQRTILQQGVVTLLSRLKRSSGGYLNQVKEFGGIVRSYTDEADIQLLQKQMGRGPSIAVATATRSFETLNVQRSEFKSQCQLLIYFSSQHGRDHQVGRQEADVVAQANPQADPGLHVMMAHTLELICGIFPTTLTSTIKQVIPIREEELVTLPEVTIWMQTYEVMMTTLKLRGRGSTEFRTPEQLLESIAWRVTTEPDEVDRPAPATSPTSIDFDTDLEE